jgi:hypothetical protein
MKIELFIIILFLILFSLILWLFNFISNKKYPDAYKGRVLPALKYLFSFIIYALLIISFIQYLIKPFRLEKDSGWGFSPDSYYLALNPLIKIEFIILLFLFIWSFILFRRDYKTDCWRFYLTFILPFLVYLTYHVYIFCYIENNAGYLFDKVGGHG